ncbi:hypothetical protein [Pseudomonas fragi]|uniref:Uncharacterized protein n=1 Tax=Pseudomonas fragi TaxID=296 RepID=A0A449IRW0_PSEFR|nr:hypothetical protein [Pseudomonas fragi]VFB22184.1 Uncharacterised protein [Pseudomonas fragi]
MPAIKQEYRAQVQSFIKAIDYANNVSEDTDFKMSKIKEEAFLPRWLTTLVTEEVRVQGKDAPDVLNFGSPVFTNTVIQKGGEDYYGFDMCNDYTFKGHAPMTINALNKTVDNYITLRNHCVNKGETLLDLDNTFKQWYGKVKGLMLPDPEAQLVNNLNEKGIAIKSLEDLQKLKGDDFTKFRELDMPNTWIALNPYVKGCRNDFVVPNRFADFENSFSKRVMDVFAEPFLAEQKKPDKPKLKM